LFFLKDWWSSPAGLGFPALMLMSDHPDLALFKVNMKQYSLPFYFQNDTFHRKTTFTKKKKNIFFIHQELIDLLMNHAQEDKECALLHKMGVILFSCCL